jgi:hypothetical protein
VPGDARPLLSALGNSAVLDVPSKLLESAYRDRPTHLVVAYCLDEQTWGIQGGTAPVWMCGAKQEVEQEGSLK